MKLDITEISVKVSKYLELYPMINGFISSIIAGILAGLVAAAVSSFFKSIFEKHRRRIYDEQFDRDIKQFSYSMKDTISSDKIQELMKLVVPLASKARYGQEVPPSKDGDMKYFKDNTVLHCKICEKKIRPTTEGRCNECKLSCSLWHEPS